MSRKRKTKLTPALVLAALAFGLGVYVGRAQRGTAHDTETNGRHGRPGEAGRRGNTSESSEQTKSRRRAMVSWRVRVLPEGSPRPTLGDGASTRGVHDDRSLLLGLLSVDTCDKALVQWPSD